MYLWVTDTWNVIKGKCLHSCIYCNYNNLAKNPCYFDKDELKTDLGTGKTIFVGNECDMFAKNIPYPWIENILKHCLLYSKNTYFFQTKHPARYLDFLSLFNQIPDIILGTTIESNLVYYNTTKAPVPKKRYLSFKKTDFRKMISIDPILNCDPEILLKWIKDINPLYVIIGAADKKYNLPEPSTDIIFYLISELRKFTVVRFKSRAFRRLV